MDYYKKLNKELAEQIQFMRMTLRDHYKEIIILRKQYFDERAAKTTIKKVMYSMLDELYEACEEQSYAKIMYILQKHKYECDSLNSSTSCYTDSNRRSSFMMAKELRRSSVMLQQIVPGVSPTRRSISKDYTSDNTSEETTNNSKSEEDISNIELSEELDKAVHSAMGTADEDNSHGHNRHFNMSNIHETDQEITPVSINSILSKNIKDTSQLQISNRDFNVPDITIESDNKENSNPIVETTLQLNSSYITERKRTNVTELKVTSLEAGTTSPFHEINSLGCSSPRFLAHELCCSTPSNSPITTVPEMEALRSRPSRRCKPTNLTERSLVVKLRNDSGKSLHSCNGKKKKRGNSK